MVKIPVDPLSVTPAWLSDVLEADVRGRELERRYFAGEGAAFAEGGTVGTEWITALKHADFDRLFGELTSPVMRVENRSRSLFGDLAAAELRAAFEQLHAMVASIRSWNSVECWLDSMCGVVRQ